MSYRFGCTERPTVLPKPYRTEPNRVERNRFTLITDNICYRLFLFVWAVFCVIFHFYVKFFRPVGEFDLLALHFTDVFIKTDSNDERFLWFMFFGFPSKVFALDIKRKYNTYHIHILKRKNDFKKYSQR